ncbi:MAG: O-methyltransferase [Solirubrobacteraceae bacterium]
MDAQLNTLLDELHRHGIEHDAARSDRLERLRNLEPQTARLPAVLVRATAARAVLELGPSHGYSTLWLADAVRATDGRVVSVELDPERSSQAAENLDRAGLSAVVELRVGDASQALRGSSDAQWDLIFLDAERPAYRGYWPDIVRALKPGGLLVVDNAISHAEEVRDFRELVRRAPNVTEVVAPTGAGALLVVRDPDAQGLAQG